MSSGFFMEVLDSKFSKETHHLHSLNFHFQDGWSATIF